MKCYITFGQIHVHSINGKTLDKDSVAQIESRSLKEGHIKAMEIFDKKFHNCTSNIPDMTYYPCGIITI